MLYKSSSVRRRGGSKKKMLLLPSATLCGIVAVLLFCVPSYSQSNTSSILGAITDQTGGAILGATVTVTDTARGTARTLTTDQAGAYNATTLTPSTYNVRVEAKGFQTFERENIILEVGGSLRLDATLRPGVQTETIIVTDAVPLVDTTNATLGGTIESTIVNSLPLNGRNFENLLNLRPGVTIYPGGGSWSQSTNGIRAHDNMYLMDGINANDPWMGMSIMNVGLFGGDAGTILPIDAIDEFKTEVKPGAQYGWKPGGVVNVGLKSGTNAIHGTAYAYGRSDAFDARDYFATAPGAIKPPLALEQFGAALGGPIKKGKLFYFLSYEDQRYTVGNPAHHNLPITGGVGAADPANSDALQGACLAALASSGGVTALSAQLAGLSLTCVPLPNYPGLFVPNNTGSPGVITNLNSSNQIDSGLVKLAYSINDKNQLSGSYFISLGHGVLVDNPPAEVAMQWLISQNARSQISGVNWTYTPNSAWVNEARVGYSHFVSPIFSIDGAENPANYSFNGSTYKLFNGQTNPVYFGLPRITFKDLSGFQMGNGAVYQEGPDAVLNFLDHVSYLHGKHSFMFGADFLILRSTTNIANSSPKGPLRFDSLQTFFNGVPDQANFLSGNLLRHLSSSGYAVFVQDDWRVRPRLTVNLGLRYEITTVRTEHNNLLGNFDPNSATGFVHVGGGIGSVFNADHNNFSPRLGFAWDVRGNGRTVVRAGGSIISEQLTYDVYSAVGNLLGLRSIPTGVALYANGATIQPSGSINVATISYSGQALNGTAPGDLAFNWAHNGPNTPLYNINPGCGDGSVTLPSGFTPQPCTIVGVIPNLRTPYV